MPRKFENPPRAYFLCRRGGWGDVVGGKRRKSPKFGILNLKQRNILRWKRQKRVPSSGCPGALTCQEVYHINIFSSITAIKCFFFQNFQNAFYKLFFICFDKRLHGKCVWTKGIRLQKLFTIIYSGI